jgi:hypothetical protein
MSKIRPNILWSSTLFIILFVEHSFSYYARYYLPSGAFVFPYISYELLGGMTLVPALMVALLGTQICREFEYSDPPFRIWAAFTVGWWWWVAGELTSILYGYFYPDYYPDFSLIDFCWLMGYFFFGLSLYYQFRLIYSAEKSGRTILYFVYIGLGLLLTWALTELAVYAGLGENVSAWWVIYISVLYPVFDLVEGSAALWLSLVFGRGTLGRLWWGLIAFAVADSINIFFWLGGNQWVSEQTYVSLDTLSGSVYVAGYMITALAFLAAYNLLRYGVQKRKMPPAAPQP